MNSAAAQRVRDTGHSIFAFTAAAIGEYLHRMHRGGDVIIGVPFLNRSSEDELRTVGCMTNMLPLRIPGDSELSMASSPLASARRYGNCRLVSDSPTATSPRLAARR